MLEQQNHRVMEIPPAHELCRSCESVGIRISANLLTFRNADVPLTDSDVSCNGAIYRRGADRCSPRLL